MVTSDQRDTLRTLTDRALLAETRRLTERERHATADVIAALMELDARKLYLGEGCSSLFAYCTQVLLMSEYAAYSRIEAARAARRFPVILDHLADGSLTLTTVGLLAAHFHPTTQITRGGGPGLTQETEAELLAAARHKSKREVERIVAAVRPLPAVPSSVRKLPAPRPIDAAVPPHVGCPAPVNSPAPAQIQTAAQQASEAPTLASAAPDLAYRQAAPTRAVVAPLAPERYKVQVTISRAAHDNLRRAQDLLRHAIPNGDPAIIFERALTLLVEDLERKKLAAAKRPRAATTHTPGSRHVPAAVKRKVWVRDEGRCTFVGAAGRCAERGYLEIHHRVPFADGGATDVSNCCLRCASHNAYDAEVWFGPLISREQSPAYG
jgi:hypothetical protein